MKWGNICTIKSRATTNQTLPVFTQFHVKWNPSKSSVIKALSKLALLEEEKNLVNWFLMKKENLKKADKRNVLISVNDFFGRIYFEVHLFSTPHVLKNKFNHHFLNIIFCMYW